jgi:hypothetical protein
VRDDGKGITSTGGFDGVRGWCSVGATRGDVVGAGEVHEILRMGI